MVRRCFIDLSLICTLISSINFILHSISPFRHYLFYLIHCQLLAEEAPNDINAYERFVLNQFFSGDISWMPLGKAITMCSASQEEVEEEKHGGHNLSKMNRAVNAMKNDILELQEHVGSEMVDIKKTLKSLLNQLQRN